MINDDQHTHKVPGERTGVSLEWPVQKGTASSNRIKICTASGGEFQHSPLGEPLFMELLNDWWSGSFPFWKMEEHSSTYSHYIRVRSEDLKFTTTIKRTGARCSYRTRSPARWGEMDNMILIILIIAITVIIVTVTNFKVSQPFFGGGGRRWSSLLRWIENGRCLMHVRLPACPNARLCNPIINRMI